MAITVTWAARVIGFVVLLFFLFWYTVFGIGSNLTDLNGQITTDIIAPATLGVLVLAAYIISWRHERLGAALFVLAAVALFFIGLFHEVFVARPMLANLDPRPSWHPFHFIRSWAFFGVPLFVTASVFLLSSMLKRQTRPACIPIHAGFIF